jgi:chemotaxis protein MotB
MMRWLLTYADMITLLMAFFIMMYSMSVLNEGKFKRAAESLRREFAPQRAEAQTESGKGHLPIPGSAAPPTPLEESVQSVDEQLQRYIEENDLADVIHTSREPRGLVISLVSDNLLFPVGEAELRPAALAILDRIAGLLAGVPNPIVVEGHTCNLPISTARFPSNWELSAARACTVVRYLVEHKAIPSRRLSATGYGDSRPIRSNATEEGRVLNRRVDIVILSQQLEATVAGAKEEA